MPISEEQAREYAAGGKREPRGEAGQTGDDIPSEPADQRLEGSLRAELEQAHKAVEHHLAQVEHHRCEQQRNEVVAEAASRAIAILEEARHGPSEGQKAMASPHRY